MTAEHIRSIGCGPIGAFASAIVGSLVFHWQVRRWSHLIPTNAGKKDTKHLLAEYKNTNRIAKAFSLAGIFVGILFYSTHWLSDYDWRGLGVGVGLACFLPVAYIVAANVMRGTEKLKEAMIAFVIDQKAPPKVLFIFIGICSIAGVVCAISLLFQPPHFRLPKG
jgi:drug/metabolite transporter (DMT)-like permease